LDPNLVHSGSIFGSVSIHTFGIIIFGTNSIQILVAEYLPNRVNESGSNSYRISYQYRPNNQWNEQDRGAAAIGKCGTLAGNWYRIRYQFGTAFTAAIELIPNNTELIPNTVPVRPNLDRTGIVEYRIHTEYGTAFNEYGQNDSPLLTVHLRIWSEVDPKWVCIRCKLPQKTADHTHYQQSTHPFTHRPFQPSFPTCITDHRPLPPPHHPTN